MTTAAAPRTQDVPKQLDFSDGIVHSGPNDSWHGRIEPNGEFPPEKNRYHLYIGLFCPFAHRANIARHMKGLQDVIDISIVKPYPKGNDKGWPGWRFPASNDEYPRATVDKLFGSEYLHQVYFNDDAEYTGRYSVPALWDTKTDRMVNNESREILRWLPLAFNDSISPELAKIDLYPEELRSLIDTHSQWIASDFNTGVYKAGFAPDQETYDKNVIVVFNAMNRIEKLIHENGGPYALGKQLTELDVLLYVTAIRFDTVYVQHFKCNLGTIRHDYPVINNWMKNLYWNVPSFRDTTDFKHIKENYTKSHGDINPKAITPMGPVPDVEEGFEPDLSKLKPGGVNLDAVAGREKSNM